MNYDNYPNKSLEKANLDDYKYLVTNSIIPSAGLGVFNNRYIKKGELIGRYKGEILTPTEYANRMNNKRSSLYVWAVHDYPEYQYRNPNETYDSRRIIYYIDGEDLEKSNFLRYVNHPRSKKEENLEVKQIEGGIYYYAKRDIDPHEELMVSYGPEYGKYLTGNEIIPDE